MQFSHHWLSDHVDLAGIAPDEIARRLTDVGLTVELVEAHGDDTVFEIDITTNRPDAMNHRGIARELAAALKREMKPNARSISAIGRTLPPELVTVVCPNLCPRFAARVVEGVNVAPSPAWLVARLEAIGLRPINNVVDATNYVLWDLGHPLHAYDRDVLEAGRIVVRRGRIDEKLVTLDGVEKMLSPEMCVIADAAKAVGVAGVMGGEHSGVTEKTKNLLIESAWFDPGSIRRTSKMLGMHTDASHRFERGADWDAVPVALDAVASLIVELAGGKVCKGRLDVLDAADARIEKTIVLRRSRIERIAGCPIPDESIAPVLLRLGFGALATDQGWSVGVPPRRVDVEIEDDLVEEVLRHHGYNNIPAVMPSWASCEGAPSAARRREQAVRDTLLAAGLDEVVTFSFVSNEEDRIARAGLPRLGVAPEKVSAPVLANPLAETQAILRTTLLSSLLPAAAHNVRHGRRDVAIFEVGRGFLGEEEAGGAIRELRLAAFLIGGRWPETWQGRKQPDFFDAKGIVEDVLGRLGVADVSWQPIREAGEGALAPGRAAEAIVGARSVAILGELSPHVLHHYDLGGTWVAGELTLGKIFGGGTGRGVQEDHILPAPPASFSFRPFSRYPAVEFDLTLEHDRSQTLASILEFVRVRKASAAEILEFVSLKDRYDGQGVAEGKVRTTLTFVYRRGDRSLTQEEVKPVHEGVVSELLLKFEATRG